MSNNIYKHLEEAIFRLKKEPIEALLTQRYYKFRKCRRVYRVIDL